MTWPANDSGATRNWLFLVEMEDGADALLRALGPFPAQGARVARMAMEVSGDIARLEVEANGLDEERAAYLRTRLQQLASVRSVAAGWR
ncbi:hypothetical protein [Phenylobacterium deserti]|uniref:ACT domain-containing protein n=1 Tax=Phenylobacterium deserti TaxID=1914756 RepID=A0A328ACK7_9CAUL|nr:hypothetical protein [Phenylobacterium deserti]RAK52482.1 hypothetical protein DJ018_09715 [Phenylobacterium deserti]